MWVAAIGDVVDIILLLNVHHKCVCYAVNVSTLERGMCNIRNSPTSYTHKELLEASRQRQQLY